MVIVHPYDIPFLVVLDDGIRKPLVYGDVLLVGRRLVEQFSLWRVRNGVVETGPQDLMAKLVVAALEFSIGDPHGEAVSLGEHTPVNIFAQLGGEAIGARPKCAYPELLTHAL